jgi:hypothetical protein
MQLILFADFSTLVKEISIYLVLNFIGSRNIALVEYKSYFALKIKCVYKIKK